MKDEIKEILDGFKEILDNPTTTDECYDGRIIEIDRSYDLDLDEINLLLDYITNLQEELKYQKQAEQEYNEKHTKLMKKYKELQERKDKAIKYLEQPYRDNFDYSKAELLNILQGSDKE